MMPAGKQGNMCLLGRSCHVLVPIDKNRKDFLIILYQFQALVHFNPKTYFFFNYSNQCYLNFTASPILFLIFAEQALDVTGTTIPEFHGNSYMMLEMNEKVAHSFAFEIWFLAKEPNGKYFP